VQVHMLMILEHLMHHNFKGKSKKKKNKMAVAAYLSAEDKTKKKIKEAILAKLKEK
jgi:hypothetical protein